MDIIYCLLMAIYLLMASKSDSKGNLSGGVLQILSAILAFIAIIHYIGR